MHTPFSPRRDFGGMEQRRNRAGRLFAAGKLILAAIARELRVSRQRSEEHTSELQSHHDLVCRLLLEKKKKQRVRQQKNLTQDDDSDRTRIRNADAGSGQ